MNLNLLGRSPLKPRLQNIESFWSLLKRGIMGSYHKVSDSYLPLYLNEFSWRFNNRNNPDIFRDLLSSVWSDPISQTPASAL